MKTHNVLGMKAVVAIAAAILMVVLAACTTAPAPVTKTITTTTTTTVPATTTTSAPTTPNATAIPPEITQYAKDWPLPNKDYANTRATMDSSINSSNVNTLGVAWSVPIQGTGGFGSAAGIVPIIQGNNVYFQDLGLDVYSINKTTGKLNWFTPFYTADIGPTGTGVAYGKVFISLDPFNTAALDANTGKVLWSQPISNTTEIGIDFQPTAYDNTVFTSSVPGSSAQSFYRGGAYGVLYGLDQQTGKINWSWNTIDDPKTFWGHPEVNSGGGAWYPPAIDTNTGMTYWGIGNPGPLAGTTNFPNGSSRPGPNLYTSSIVAIDHSTGKLQWFFQPQPHDINDYDLQISPICCQSAKMAHFQTEHF
jgi:glucose dehydrogenase